jgi:diguanylate cyclase (GGDEF)-like protein
MTQIVLHPLPLPSWSQAAVAYGAVGGLSMMAWALAALSGRLVSRHLLWPMLAVLLLALLAVLPLGTRGITWFVTWGLAGGSVLVLALGHRLVLRPRDLNERLAGIVMVLMAGTSALRAAYLFTWDGPYEPHLLHMPPAMVLPYALMYGVLPIVFAMLMFNVLAARLQARLHQRAMTDALTGVLSRLALAEGAAGLLERLHGSGQRLAVVMVDLDHFKQVNDRLGHASGDAVLRHAAQRLQASLRPQALLARYGGEEFVALVPVEDLPVARRVAERLRTSLHEAAWGSLVPGLSGVTASFGVTLLEPRESIERALARADEALYRAKNAGRNQVQVGLVAA